jgi:hypothetical protein
MIASSSFHHFAHDFALLHRSVGDNVRYGRPDATGMFLYKTAMCRGPSVRVGRNSLSWCFSWASR